MNESVRFFSEVLNLEIAFANAVGSLFAVGIPTFIDSKLEHHIMGNSLGNYPMGYWVLLIGVLVFLLTLIVNVIDNSHKAFYTVLAIVIPTYLTLPNFLPQLPHLNVVIMPVYFGLISGGVVLIRDYKVDLSFLKSSKENIIKLEQLKVEYDFWFKVGVTSFGTYATIIITTALQINNIFEIITPEPIEIFYLETAFLIVLIANIIWFLTGLMREIIRKIMFIKQQINNII